MLLTAYADTDAAITSINAIDLDYYLLKPWDPPEERSIPCSTTCSTTGGRTRRRCTRASGSRHAVVAHDHAVKDFLARNQIPYQWLDIEQDTRRPRPGRGDRGGQVRLPVVFLPDGTVL